VRRGGVAMVNGAPCAVIPTRYRFAMPPTAEATFVQLLTEQVRHEFTASQQYVAIAVWFDGRDLPRLATHFYLQSVEERNHAMMMVRYMLDRDWPVTIPGVDEVRNAFDKPHEPIALALAQERSVTGQMEALFRAARSEGDVLGEQFMLWFLKEQVEETAAMSTLLTIAERAGEDWFQIEDHLAREAVGDGGGDASAPEAAGGAL
jgi:bacterioferritin B